MSVGTVTNRHKVLFTTLELKEKQGTLLETEEQLLAILRRKEDDESSE